MPAPAGVWACAAMLIVSRTAAAAAKVVANFFMRSSNTIALMRQWTNGASTRRYAKILRRSGAVVETLILDMRRIQGQVGGRGYLRPYRISAPQSSPHQAAAKIGTGEMPTRRHLLEILGGACAAASLPARAAEFPSGAVSVIVSFPAGGSIDVIVRAMAGRLQEELGKAIVVENRAGAGGVLAAGDVVKAAPDGQTLLAAASSLAANPTLVKALPYDTVRPAGGGADLPHAAGAGGRSEIAGSYGDGAGGAVEAKTRPDQFRPRRARLGDPSGRRTVPGHDRHDYDRHFLSRRAAGAQRRDGRSRGADVRRRRQRDGTDQCRHGAAARRVVDDPRSGAARCAYSRRGRRGRLRRGRLDPDLRAGGDAAAGRGTAERGAQESRRRARGAIAHDQARHHSG